MPCPFKLFGGDPRRGVNAAFRLGAAGPAPGTHIVITVDLGLGSGRGEILTNDLTHGYVDENMGTS